MFVSKNRIRVNGVKLHQLLYVNCSGSGVRGHNFTEPLLVERKKLGANLDRTFLKRIAVLIGWRPLPRTHFRHPLPEGQPYNCRPFIVEILLREVFHPEELPPFDLLFPLMPIQRMGKEPPG